jgi:hypothetical protein
VKTLCRFDGVYGQLFIALVREVDDGLFFGHGIKAERRLAGALRRSKG